MYTNLKVCRASVLAVALLLMVPCMWSQDDAMSQRSSTRTNSTAELSDLAQDNLDLVAASTVQIRAILVKDAGLSVELKRWVAKEATDSGQVLQPSVVSDDAIFARLDRDIRFRAIATRLLQRYGYLLPVVNPESKAGKEQDYVLKERARRLVQVEAQEDDEIRRPRSEERDGAALGQKGACFSDTDPDCGTGTQRTQQHLSIPPEDGNRVPSPTPSVRQPEPPVPLLKSGIEDDDRERKTGNFNSEFALASDTSEIETRRPIAQFNAESASKTDSSDLRSMIAESSIPPIQGREPAQSVSHPTRRRATPPYSEEDVTPVKMVHAANPYADVPSLYDMYVQAASSQRAVRRFGIDVFRGDTQPSDALPMDLPVGPDYVVGSGDSLAIDLWGSVSQRFVRVVDREGRLSLPEAGPLLVAGKNLGDIQLEIQRVLRNVFRDVSADVSLSRVRTIRVYVVGDVAQPGAYDISSLSTPLNALFAASGVTARGSLRRLKHFRGKELVQQVDAYDLLLHGVRSDLKRLESGDTLLVSPLGPQVTIEGMVRRPGIYELRDETSLADALELSGGILPTATLRHVELQRVEANEKRTMLTLDLSSSPDRSTDSQLQGVQVRDGDQIHIFPIAAYNEDAIYLQGHVLRPGRYSFKPGMKISDLVSSYADLLPEPAPHYAEIVRLNPPDFHPTVESFDLSQALSDSASAPALQRLDTVRIFSRYNFERPPAVFVGGEVHAPGDYRTPGQAHLRDAIFLAGGVTPDAALDTAQLFRAQADGTLRILSVDLRQALAGNPVDNILIQPRDRLLVHRKTERIDTPTVNITGEVAKPGRYPLTANMHISDLIRVSGGLKRSAFGDAADLTRFAATNGSSSRVEVKLTSALAGDINEDVPLHNGDVLAIRQIPQWNDLGASVTISGEVQHPATYGIQPGEKLSSLLARCNGLTPEAYPYGAVLVRREVRDLEMRSHIELVNRIKAEESYLKALPEGDADQKSSKLTAIAQTETALSQLEATSPAGRVVIHIPSDLKKLANSPSDVPLRDGDMLMVPKKTNYVMVSGEVFNPTAVSYLPGRSAKWYLSQSGGLTQIADKNAVFVIRADGSVLSAKNNSGIWSGDPLNAVLKPGDSIVVPEKAPKVASRNWASLLQAAQVASSIALTVGYLHP